MSRLYLLLFLFLTAQFGFAQLQLPQEATITHNDADRPAWKTVLPAEKDPAKDAFADFVKDAYDIKLKGLGLFANKDFLEAEEIEPGSLTDKTANFYASFESSGENTTMWVFLSFGYDIYAGPEAYQDTYQRLKRLSERFLKQFLPEYYTSAIEDLMDKVDDLTDDISDQEKDIVKNREEIESLKQEITEGEANLETLRSELEKAKSRLEVLRATQSDLNTKLGSISMER